MAKTSALSRFEKRIDAVLEAGTRVFMAHGPQFADGISVARVTLWPEYRQDFADFAAGRVWNDAAKRFETLTQTQRTSPLPEQVSAAECVLAWLGEYIDYADQRRLMAALLRHRVFRRYGHVRRAMDELGLRVNRSTVHRQYVDGLAQIVIGICEDRVCLDAIEKKLLT